MERKRKSSMNKVFQDAPTVSAPFITGPTTMHDDSATIHRGGAAHSHYASTIRYGATRHGSSRKRAGSTTTSSSYCIRDESG